MSALQKVNILCPPEAVRGITSLDKSLFTKFVPILCLRVDKADLPTVMPLFKNYLLKVPKINPVEKSDDTDVVIYLNPNKIRNQEELEQRIENLKNDCLSKDNIEVKEVKLEYENYSIEATLKAILPVDKEGSSSFTQVGHIVHLNLREWLLSYKQVIGNVLLDKIAVCRSVVNKISHIDNTYRNFRMEIICGDSDMETKVKENNCAFEFDFSKVYWNSRLCTEHERVLRSIGTDDVLFDVFSGVGPFAIPAAKKKAYVFANDLNPQSYRWLNHNVDVNRLDRTYIKGFNKDAKDFILQDIKELLPKFINKHNIYITMNLPALAVTFLKHFVGLYEIGELPKVTKPPILYLYCFAKGENRSDIMKELLTTNLGFDISDKIGAVFKVRTVSSLKEMMRVTILLDDEVLNGEILKRQNSKRKAAEKDNASPRRLRALEPAEQPPV